MTIPPSNRLVKLKGGLRGYHSIRINDQWRVFFRWEDGTPTTYGSSTTTQRRLPMADPEFAPVTPGEILKEEFLAEYDLSQNQLARAIDISANRIADVVNNRRRITADTAVRLSLYLGNSAEFWLNLQAHYDLKVARKSLSPETAAHIERQRAA